MERKLTKRQAQAQDTQKRIYDSFLTLMQQKKFDGITIEEISKEAGVSVGTIYHYYKSKEDMFFELYRLIDEYYEKVATSEILDRGPGAPEQIEEFFRHYALYIEGRGIEGTGQLYNTNNKIFIDETRYMVMLLRNIIVKGQEKGELSKIMSPERMADYCFIVGRGVVFDWCLRSGDYSLEEAMMNLIGWLVRSLKIQGAAAESECLAADVPSCP